VKPWLAAIACALTLACSCALAQPPHAGLTQHVGARVPLDVAVVDENGQHRTLASFVDGSRPVLLVPGYYRCAQLCGLVIRSLVDALRASGTPPNQWRIVGVSIDPRETAADARARRDLDLAYAGRDTDLHLLTLAPDELARVADAIGIHFESVRSDDGAVTIAHPATVVVLTPRGEISRYFNGVGLDGKEMSVALADAAGNRIGGITSRLALLCAHFDPSLGVHSAAVMNGMRIVSFLLVAALGGWIWRHRRGGTR
jgi:protein SCO1/2